MEWNATPVVTDNATEVLDRYSIQDYAKICLTNLDRYKAALELTNGNQSDAMVIAHHWSRSYELDRIIKAMKNDPRAIREIASKFDVAMLYWSIASSPIVDAKDRIKAASEFAAIAGIYDQRAGGGIGGNAVQAVMIVKDFGNNSDWENAAAIQQAKLVNQRNEQREQQRTA
ncbi:terminase small subunit [Acinetobacter phage IMEAB3]|uniref:Putative terminase small subunit n=1 Tax=Acinetobacter phage IMEAB3 TaxID=1458669 RepID=W6ARA8_9CAUD|nr:terminase small subunit [Acinetobacter phage IMEAB3]AHI60041.1 putative terminase small subunit [Acinetobacter phage IMEAB3]